MLSEDILKHQTLSSIGRKEATNNKKIGYGSGDSQGVVISSWPLPWINYDSHNSID